MSALADLDFLQIGLLLAVLIASLSVHEAAHAWAADRLGDPTARRLGRLSLNPLVHIDPIGTVLFPLVAIATGVPLIGWAKPVPVDMRNLQAPRRDFALVAAAGPASNLVMAAGAAAIFTAMAALGDESGGVRYALVVALFNAVLINVLLAVFNLIPVPPLDGGNILLGVLPASMVGVVRTDPSLRHPGALRSDVFRGAARGSSIRCRTPSWVGCCDDASAWCRGCARRDDSTSGTWWARSTTGSRCRRDYDCYYFVADWHALTSDYADTSDLVANALDNVADWIGCGIDPERSTIFVQSLVPEHAELYLLLSMVTPIPWLERVPTYKEQPEQLVDRDLSQHRLPRLSAAADGRRHHLRRPLSCRSAKIRCRTSSCRGRWCAASTTSTARSSSSRSRCSRPRRACRVSTTGR